MNKALTLTLLVVPIAIGIPSITLAQNCDDIRNNVSYFSASASGLTEQEARANALTLLAENISSVVSSRTDMVTNDDGIAGHQKFSSYSKSTSLLQLKGVQYATCNRNKKTGVTALAFISRTDLEQSAAEVSARVQQYLSLMEQKEAKGTDFLPEAYIAYLNTFMSPYAIEYHSPPDRPRSAEGSAEAMRAGDTRHITNVRSYLESYLRTFLSNITVTCPAVTENPEYPNQQLTMALSLTGATNTRMGFLIEIPEYNAKTFLDGANGNIDIIMTPESRNTKFTAKLSLVPPPLEAELKDISDRVGFSREVTFEASMSGIIKVDFNSRRELNELLLTPAIEHLTVYRYEWLSDGVVLSTEKRPRIAATGLKEITLRINRNDNLVVTKVLAAPLNADSPTGYGIDGKSFVTLEAIDNTTNPPLEQFSNPFPQDAVLLVYSNKADLSFHSSMSAIDRQTYNAGAGRYELLVRPLKQILTVSTGQLMEKNETIINPQPGDVFYFRAKVVTTNKGWLAISSFPSSATVFINDIETAYRTPCTIEVNSGLTKVSVQKRYFQTADTVVRVDVGITSKMPVILSRDTGTDALSYLNGRHEREYYFAPEDPAKAEAATALRNYQRQTIILKRRAAMYYSTAILGLSVGAGYHWLDRTLFDSNSGSHTSIMSGMGNAFYIMGGAALVGGIITSVKLSHLKKKWEVTPTPVVGGAGLLVTYKFK